MTRVFIHLGRCKAQYAGFGQLNSENRLWVGRVFVQKVIF